MKKIFLILFLLFSLLFNKMSVKANYTCTYDDFKIIFSDKGTALEVDPPTVMKSGAGYVISYTYELDESLTQSTAVEPGKCENVTRCVINSSANGYGPVGGSAATYRIFSDSMPRDNDPECKEFAIHPNPTSEDISEESGDNSVCRTYNNLFIEMEEKYKECNNTDCNIYSIAKEKLKGLCHNVVENRDFNDSCLIKCLDLNQDIYDKIEGNKSSSNDENCGLTTRMLVWINNIVKWVKYILPVIVIVLGILDFIKAVGSDKEDDMKKAQGKFMKRLIAAALVFIVPLILEFILEKMGFNSATCGIKF